MKKIGLLILTLPLLSCNSDSDKLFLINENSKHHSDFLFMTESTNVLPISADSVKLFLNWNEIDETKYLESNIYPSDTILPKPVVYKDFGEIYKSDNFKLHVILREGNNTIGRDYTFILRTFSLDWKIIESYELASWIDSENRHCYGSVDRKLIVQRTCEDGKTKDIRQIGNNGRILVHDKNIIH